MTYSEKLKDPRWQKRRLEVFNRRGFACECCGSKDQTLHVHHLVYSGEPWDAPFDNLESLCESCHAFREGCDELVGVKSKLPTVFIYAFMRFSVRVSDGTINTKDLDDCGHKFIRFWHFIAQAAKHEDGKEVSSISNNP